MENNGTKAWHVALGILALIVIAIVIWGTSREPVEVPIVENNGNVDNVIEDPSVNATQLCYIWNTEAGDSAKLSMDIRADKVIGEFYWLPAEKDSKTGIFEGTVTPVDKMTMSRTVNALWKSSGEGMTNTEELIIKFGEGTANVGFGEMVLGSDGIWRYADPENLSFVPNLSDTDCGDEAMD